jgi:hypothetical protein
MYELDHLITEFEIMLLHVCALFSTSWTPAAGPKPLRWPALSRAHRFAGAVVDPQMAFSLPSFSRGSSEPEGPSEEAQGLYRMLGLAEDATYDEINEAYEVLATKYAGETKRLINLQVAKDKILEDRLRQRMSGSLKASVSESPFERRDEPRKLISLPPFLEGVMELPTRQELTKNAIVFAYIGLLPVLSLSWASTSVSLGFAASLYLLYNRGVPDSGNTMGAEMRPPKVGRSQQQSAADSVHAEIHHYRCACLCRYGRCSFRRASHFLRVRSAPP